MDGQTVCRIRVSTIPIMYTCPLLTCCSRRMPLGQIVSLYFHLCDLSFLSLFRQVVEGWEVLERLEGVETYNERPKELCQVSNSGRVSPLD